MIVYPIWGVWVNGGWESRRPERAEGATAGRRRVGAGVSQDVADGQFFVADGLTLCPFGIAQHPEQDRVGAGLDDLEEAGFEAGELRFGRFALEDAVLDARQVG